MIPVPEEPKTKANMEQIQLEKNREPEVCAEKKAHILTQL